MKRKELWWPLLRVERFILIVTSLLAAGLVTAGVFTRYVLKADFLGMEEVVTVVAMWLYWVGGLYGSRNDNHIQGNLIESMVKSPRARKILRLVVLGISILVIAVFAVWSIEYLLWSIDRGAVSTALKIPMVLAHLPLAVGFVMMFVYTGYHFIRTLRTELERYDEMIEEIQSWN